MRRILLSLVIALGALSARAALAQEAYKLELPPGSAAVDPAAGGSIQFIGTATVLIRYQGFTILTDPNFLHKGQKVHLGYGLTSERLTNPAVEMADLPPIDLVILSHMHEDHFDREVQEKLDKAIPIVTTKEAAASLARMGFQKRYPLGTWDALEVTKGAARLRITSTPGRHGKGLLAALLPSVMGSVLDFGDGKYRMYITGDTLIYDDLNEIPKRFPNVDLALLHLGGTRILGTFKVTMDGQDGVRMMQLIAPRTGVPIHYNDYDVFKSPLSDFREAVKAAGLENKVVYLKHGEAYTFVPGKQDASSPPR